MLQAGKYYVGDLCYLFENEDWDLILDSTNDLQSKTGYFGYEGVKFFSSHTAFGDGAYLDQFGNVYWVDAGLIGCYPVSENQEEVQGGHIVDFPSDFECQHVNENGRIRIGHLCIETNYGMTFMTNMRTK